MEASSVPQPAVKRERRNFRLEPADLELIDQLKAEHREILLCDGSYVERATKLNLAIGTVRSRLHRARAALEALRAGHPVIDSRVSQLN